MAYTPLTWANDTKITATAFNHLETIYSEACSTFIDDHTHDTRYYPKATAMVTFFSTSFMGNGSGSDADLLDNHHVSDLIGESIPLYGIVWWNDNSANLPSGWYVCNGANGTTDYRDHFIVGANADSGSTYNVKSHYGSNTVTPAATVTIGTHALTTSEIPAHIHTNEDRYESSPYDNSSGGGASRFVSSTTDTGRTSGSAGSGTAHGHSGSSVTYNSETNVPPYYVMYLVQRRV